MASFQNQGTKLVLQGEQNTLGFDLSTRDNFTVAVGYQANLSNSGQFNTVVGYQALLSAQTIQNALVIGYLASYSAQSNSNLISIGNFSQYLDQFGYDNIGLGHSNLYSNYTGYSNVAIGTASLFTNSTGIQNTTLGHNTLLRNVTGSKNVAVGNNAGQNTIFGDENVFMGFSNSVNSETADANVMIGARNGVSLLTSSSNVCIGHVSDAEGGQCIVVGAGSKSTASNGYVYGTRSINTGSNSVLYGKGLSNSGSNSFIFHNNIVKQLQIAHENGVSNPYVSESYVYSNASNNYINFYDIIVGDVVEKKVQLNADLQFNNDIDFYGAVNCHDTLTAKGSAVFESNTTFQDQVDMEGNFFLSGNGVLGTGTSTLQLNAPTEINNSLNTYDNVKFNDDGTGTTTFTTDTIGNFNGDTYFNSNVYFTETSTVDIAPPLTLSNTLNVDGEATFNSNLQSYGSVYLYPNQDGTNTFTNSIPTSFSNSFDTYSNVYHHQIEGQSNTYTNELISSFDGDTYFNSNVYFTDTSTVDIAPPLTLSNTLNVDGEATFNSNLQSYGSVYLYPNQDGTNTFTNSIPTSFSNSFDTYSNVYFHSNTNTTFINELNTSNLGTTTFDNSVLFTSNAPTRFDAQVQILEKLQVLGDTDFRGTMEITGEMLLNGKSITDINSLSNVEIGGWIKLHQFQAPHWWIYTSNYPDLQHSDLILQSSAGQIIRFHDLLDNPLSNVDPTFGSNTGGDTGGSSNPYEINQDLYLDGNLRVQGTTTLTGEVKLLASDPSQLSRWYMESHNQTDPVYSDLSFTSDRGSYITFSDNISGAGSYAFPNMDQDYGVIIGNKLLVNGTIEASNATIQSNLFVNNNAVIENYLQLGGSQAGSWVVYSSNYGTNNIQADLHFRSSNGAIMVFNDKFVGGESSFTGQHRCSFEKFNYGQDKIGKIVCATGQIKNLGQNIYKKEGFQCDEALPVVELSKTTKEKRVFGVVSGIEKEGQIEISYGHLTMINNDIENDEQKLIVNSSGNGYIACSETVSENIKRQIKNGDYIHSSDYEGIGIKQESDVLHNYTVAKVLQDYNQSEHIFRYKNIEYRLLACIYYC